MNIPVSPEWTFVEAVQAAWNAYSGGQEYGTTNRIRLLEQWANVVGRRRAESELETTVKKLGGVQKAARQLGFSVYAINKLRQSFREMPSITPHALSAPTFHEFLLRLAELKPDTEISFLIQVVPGMASLLGYSESEIYYDVIIPGGIAQRIDAVFAPAGPSIPHVVLELKQTTRGLSVLESSRDQAEQCRIKAKAPFGIVISPQHLVVLSESGQASYPLANITAVEADLVQATLWRPDSARLASPTSLAPAGAKLQDLLQKVTAASTNEEKKSSLESLAAAVFDAHDSVRCKYRNLRTRSSEIDIVCEVTGAERQIPLRELGRYFLVECKNWSVPAGANEIRDFLGVLRSSRVHLGIYFSRKGITGERHGTDALLEIHDGSRDGTYIVVISEQDLLPLRHLLDVFRVIDDKLDALRFNF